MKKNLNPPEVKFSPRFDKHLRDAPDEIIEAFFEALALFIEDSDHPFLRNHSLKKKFVGYRSIDVTGDWRALFKETNKGKIKIVTFHMLGTHEELYGKKA